MRLASVVFAASLALAAGEAALARTAHAGPAPLTEAQAVAQILDADTRFSQVTGEKRLEGFLSFLSDSAMTLQPDTTFIQGIAGFRDVWAGLNNPNFHIVWHPVHAYASACGDLGYSTGVAEYWREANGEKTRQGSSKYLTVWRRQADGAWKVVFDTGVQDSPKKAPEKPAEKK